MRSHCAVDLSQSVKIHSVKVKDKVKDPPEVKERRGAEGSIYTGKYS